MIWNSTALSQAQKVRNFWSCSGTVRQLNDTICIENDCSIVENPKCHSKSYSKCLGDKKKPSHWEQICAAVDDAQAQRPDSFETLLELLRQTKYDGRQWPICKTMNSCHSFDTCEAEEGQMSAAKQLQRSIQCDVQDRHSDQRAAGRPCAGVAR